MEHHLKSALINAAVRQQGVPEVIKRTTEELIAEAEARLPEWAVARAHGELAEGAQLPTRDGRRMGNAHIIKVAPGLHSMPSLNYLILTDAGNTVVFSEMEIRDQFHPPEYIARVDEVIEKFWRKDVPLLEAADLLPAM